MGKRIVNELKQWSKQEIIFYSIVIGLFTVIMTVAGIILDFNVLYILFGVFAMLSFALAIKKTFVGYVLIVVTMGMYAVFAYTNKFYSELFAVGLFVLPYVIVEIIRWVKQKKNKPTLPQGKRLIVETVVAVACAGLLFFGAYKMLYVLQNNWLVGATFAVVAAAGFLCMTTYASKLLSSMFLSIYVALACACWVFCAVFSDISFAAIGLAMLAITIMALRVFVNYAIAYAKQKKCKCGQVENLHAVIVEEEPKAAEEEIETQPVAEMTEEVSTEEQSFEVAEVEAEVVEEEVVKEKTPQPTEHKVKRRRGKRK